MGGIPRLNRWLAAGLAVGLAIWLGESVAQSPRRSIEKNPPPGQPGHVFRDTLKDGSYGPEMIVIPAGVFDMGSPREGVRGCGDEDRLFNVRIPKLAVGRYETTFDDYDRFVAATQARRPDDRGWGRDSQPVIDVNWFDAQAYAAWLTAQTGYRYRLPTEAEWEYAARGKTTTFYWWGETLERGQANCWGCGSRWDNRLAAPVDTLARNPFGLFHVHGNVYEWTCSSFGTPLDQNALECAAPTTSPTVWRVLRGGAWPHEVRGLGSPCRFANDPTTRLSSLGFRLVREWTRRDPD